MYRIPQLVRIPEGPPWEDSHEGGVSFYLCVRAAKRDVNSDREPPPITWGVQDCAQNPQWDGPCAVDAAILIGSTKLTLRDAKTQQLFQPTADDLLPQGLVLYDLLVSMYGEVEIVTLLST